MINDQKAREQATIPTQSFIVEAPAGSGKTEILTQRFLTLLCNVESPEHIIALTFTKKAASEMKGRILGALENAASDVEPQSAHQLNTFRLAKRVLERDKKHNWQLISQPSRLRISTIDALCQRLVQSIPLLAEQNTVHPVTDNPEELYREAASNLMEFLLENQAYQPHLRQILKHLDNQQGTLIDLFVDLLAQRDQWLSPLFQAKQQSRQEFEDALKKIAEHELKQLHRTLDKTTQRDLVHFMGELASLPSAPTELKEVLETPLSLSNWTQTQAKLLGKLFLTAKGTLRKRLDKYWGLNKTQIPAAKYESLKANWDGLIEKLADQPSFAEKLSRIQQMPPATYADNQWQILQSLFVLLPLLVAHLELVFKAHQSVDFSYISALALEALGDEEAPTDLALYLDYQIHHLLIDEFQDTSIQQFDLIRNLTREWMPNQNKTLFIVGDPMQSIYRFRSAEVGLFLRAKQQGIGAIPLTPLELTSNFRSTPTLVNWVNTSFQTIFPNQEDIESGAISYRNAQATQTSEQDSFLTAFEYESSEAEALSVVTLAEKELATYPDDEIAILVRSRNNLTQIIQVLRQKEIAYQGVDIAPLAQLPHLMDAWSLTQALLMPSNRLSWLAFLRSPWCGLSLEDIHSLAQLSPQKSIPQSLKQAAQLDTLSETGKQRCQALSQIFKSVLACRSQQSLSRWIRATLEQLNQDAILTPHEQLDLEPFWRLLDQFEQGGRLSSWHGFKTALDKLYSKRAQASRLKIMTIHKSKGLEFDSVILPHLSTRQARSSKPLFRWLNLPSITHNLFLVSPIKAAIDENCLLYNFLENVDKDKGRFETQRLLYVAATRAKKRLHLFDHKTKAPSGSFRDDLKHIRFNSDPSIVEGPNEPIQALPELRMLPHPPTYTETLDNKTLRHQKLCLTTSEPYAKHLGIACHALLQWLCDMKPSEPNKLPLSLTAQYFRQVGMSQKDSLSLTAKVKEQVHRFLAHPKGQWIIQTHEDEHNEYELQVKKDGAIKTFIIDRTFIDNGTRWIIDYKTGKQTEATKSKHKKQLNTYATLMAKLGNEPIRCGVFYLGDETWEAWAIVEDAKAPDYSFT